jgi:hypothetical protein
VPEKELPGRQATLPQKVRHESKQSRARTTLQEELQLPTAANLFWWCVYRRGRLQAQRRLHRAAGLRGRYLQGRPALLQVRRLHQCAALH